MRTESTPRDSGSRRNFSRTRSEVTSADKHWTPIYSSRHETTASLARASALVKTGHASPARLFFRASALESALVSTSHLRLSPAVMPSPNTPKSRTAQQTALATNLKPYDNHRFHCSPLLREPRQG
jgi:hypothetical protein